MAKKDYEYVWGYQPVAGTWTEYESEWVSKSVQDLVNSQGIPKGLFQGDNNYASTVYSKDIIKETLDD